MTGDGRVNIAGVIQQEGLPFLRLERTGAVPLAHPSERFGGRGGAEMTDFVLDGQERLLLGREETQIAPHLVGGSGEFAEPLDPGLAAFRDQLGTVLGVALDELDFLLDLLFQRHNKFDLLEVRADSLGDVR